MWSTPPCGTFHHLSWGERFAVPSFSLHFDCKLAKRSLWRAILLTSFDQIREMYVISMSERRRRRWNYSTEPCSTGSARKIQHLARIFVRLLHEFRASDKSTDEDIDRYDPKVWGRYGFRSEFPFPSHHPRAGYYQSLLWAYLELNLLLAGPKGILEVLWPKDYSPLALTTALGRNEGSHPIHLASHLWPAFPHDSIGPLTADVLTILRDHAAMMFRCMYSIRGENKLLDEEIVKNLLFDFFEWKDPTAPEGGRNYDYW